MQKLQIALIGIIIILAFIGGYFMGVLNSSGNFTLNVTNQSNNSGSTGSTGIQTAQHRVSNTIQKVSYTKKNVTTITPKKVVNNKTNSSQ
ncbi:MAG: hypothetical protein ACXVZU_00370 [Methanobacteriaceae archaeon]